MPLKHSDILSFFIKCVEAESYESFRLPQNKKHILDVSNHISGIESILNGDERFITIVDDSKLNNFLTYKNNHKKNDKIFLAVEIISKKDRYGTSLFPIYIIEFMLE